MTAQLMEFNPYLVDAVAMMALSPESAWRIELLMGTDEDFTKQDENTVIWIDLVNTPVELLEVQ